YETLGVDNNAVYIGSNRFNGGFANTDLFVIRKSALLAGSLVVTPFRNLIGATQGMFTPWPCSNDDPAATTGFVIGVDAFSFGKLVARRVTDPGGTPAISSDIAITVPTTANPADVSIPINNAGGTLTIDALDDRLFFARLAKNRITGETFAMTAHSIRTDSAGVGGAGDRNSARWYQIGNVFSGTPSLTSGTAVDTAASGFQHLTIASTALNGQGHQLIGFTRANATTSPGVGISYRNSGSALVSAPVLAQAGVNYYNLQSGANNKRWGDYSFTVVDPRNMMTMWTFQEYSSANNQWGTRAVEVKAPAPTVTTVAPASGNRGQTLNVVVTGTGIFDPDPSYPDHLSFNFGANVTVNSVTWNSATQATVNITIGTSAATGARPFTLTNPDGQTANGQFTVNTGNISIAGTINLPGWIGTGAGVGAPQFVFELRNATTNAVLATQTVALGASNTFNWSVAQPGNTQYKLWIKGVKRFLGVVQTINTGASGVSGLAYTLPNGDIDGNNIVSTSDYNALRAAWGATSTNANWATYQWADLDGNGFVGTADYNLMRATWGSVGNP
ncbi:MAG TPA: hypothetical protein VK171_12435, partial [Fimbriimonas sp.]|nr:hypothetical protein [Fimbriimonas sp.]